MHHPTLTQSIGSKLYKALYQNEPIFLSINKITTRNTKECQNQKRLLSKNMIVFSKSQSNLWQT
jgi:hypothetical protein